MIEKDAKQYDSFCKFIEGRSAFSPWLDDYDPSTEEGFAFVYAGAEDNGRFGIGDLDLYFNTRDFSYKDILEKVKNYLSECEETLSRKDDDEPENLETEYVENLRELVQAIESWVAKSNESKKPESCKDGKKESMERCDSCGAVMTEYDYDRYGGLCKHCRDKGEAKKPAESSKKSEGIGDRIKMGIDYNMFMRMCRTAAYLDEDEDYWDALWEYYSEMGEIEDALVFFDNLFQYTAWCDADELYDEYLDDKFKDDSKSKEECIDAAIDGGDLQAYKHENGNYLVIL